MSYRDDHDAALARIDALEEELSLLRNQQPPAPEAQPTRRWTKGMLSMTGILFAIAALCIGIARYGSPMPKLVAPAPEPVAAAVAKPSHLMDCVAQLDAAIAAKRSIGADCIEQIADQAHDSSLGDDVHDVLRHWLAAEQAMTAGTGRAQRDELADTIHAVVRPEFTR